jgi:hypothetical protein
MRNANVEHRMSNIERRSEYKILEIKGVLNLLTVQLKTVNCKLKTRINEVKRPPNSESEIRN